MAGYAGTVTGHHKNAVKTLFSFSDSIYENKKALPWHRAKAVLLCIVFPTHSLFGQASAAGMYTATDHILLW